MMLSGFFVSKGINNKRSSIFARGKKRILTCQFLDGLASLRPATIESPTISDVLGIHSSASVLLSGLLVLFDTSDSVVESIGGAFECSVEM